MNIILKVPLAAAGTAAAYSSMVTPVAVNATLLGVASGSAFALVQPSIDTTPETFSSARRFARTSFHYMAGNVGRSDQRPRRGPPVDYLWRQAAAARDAARVEIETLLVERRASKRDIRAREIELEREHRAKVDQLRDALREAQESLAEERGDHDITRARAEVLQRAVDRMGPRLGEWVAALAAADELFSRHVLPAGSDSSELAGVRSAMSEMIVFLNVEGTSSEEQGRRIARDLIIAKGREIFESSVEWHVRSAYAQIIFGSDHYLAWEVKVIAGLAFLGPRVMEKAFFGQGNRPKTLIAGWIGVDEEGFEKEGDHAERLAQDATWILKQRERVFRAARSRAHFERRRTGVRPEDANSKLFDQLVDLAVVELAANHSIGSEIAKKEIAEAGQRVVDTLGRLRDEAVRDFSYKGVQFSHAFDTVFANDQARGEQMREMARRLIRSGSMEKYMQQATAAGVRHPIFAYLGLGFVGAGTRDDRIITTGIEYALRAQARYGKDRKVAIEAKLMKRGDADPLNEPIFAVAVRSIDVTEDEPPLMQRSRVGYLLSGSLSDSAFPGIVAQVRGWRDDPSVAQQEFDEEFFVRWMRQVAQGYLLLGPHFIDRYRGHAENRAEAIALGLMFANVPIGRVYDRLHAADGGIAAAEGLIDELAAARLSVYRDFVSRGYEPDLPEDARESEAYHRYVAAGIAFLSHDRMLQDINANQQRLGQYAMELAAFYGERKEKPAPGRASPPSPPDNDVLTSHLDDAMTARLRRGHGLLAASPYWGPVRTVAVQVFRAERRQRNEAPAAERRGSGRHQRRMHTEWTTAATLGFDRLGPRVMDGYAMQGVTDAERAYLMMLWWYERGELENFFGIRQSQGDEALLALLQREFTDPRLRVFSALQRRVFQRIRSQRSLGLDTSIVDSTLFGGTAAQLIFSIAGGIDGYDPNSLETFTDELVTALQKVERENERHVFDHHFRPKPQSDGRRGRSRA